jgi:hypothetical protein
MSEPRPLITEPALIAGREWPAMADDRGPAAPGGRRAANGSGGKRRHMPSQRGRAGVSCASAEREAASPVTAGPDVSFASAGHLHPVTRAASAEQTRHLWLPAEGAGDGMSRRFATARAHVTRRQSTVPPDLDGPAREDAR